MAKRHDFSYFFHEGLSNMFSHGFMSFAAIGITVACLLIMGTFTLVAVNANELLTTLEQENEILAYVDDSYTETQARALKVPGWRPFPMWPPSPSFPGMRPWRTSRPSTRMRSCSRTWTRRFWRTATPSSWWIWRRRARPWRRCRPSPGISDVSHYEEIAGGFVTVRNVATVVCVALIAILFVVSVFIISNTIKLTTFDRREEIAIMRMVGATNGFIRWPFVYEGFMLGLLGAVIAFFLQWALYAAVARGVDSNDTLQLIQVMPFSELWAPVAAVFALAGIVIGVGGSLSAIRKFLQV